MLTSTSVVFYKARISAARTALLARIQSEVSCELEFLNFNYWLAFFPSALPSWVEVLGLLAGFL